MAEVTVVSETATDELIVKPLGGGQEVGRSCILLSFKEKNILLDCGIHPGMTGVDALPFVDLIDCERIDLLLITHFHLDHCGALPWFLEKTSFRGRCFMTHATKAIYRMILSDYIKVSNIGADHMLYSENELEKSMDKIEQKEVNGIKFWCYVAGHVLGACMFMIEIAGVKVLYTGDFSRLEDRHLCAADMPNIRPDALILESTYGTQIHENRDIRENRFTSVVRGIVTRGGRCLIPVFALGRAQELLLILDEYWSKCEELRDIPIYYASSLARKCMSVYQTFVSGMNSSIQKQIAVRNPFNFKHVKYLRSIDYFEDIGPCVVLATPGMLQSGLSRELFESWCSEPKNGCIIAGYCVEGTLAKHILTEPDEIAALNGHRLSVRMQIAYISFSAHTDYNQTSDFIRQLKPPNAIFVHGEASEMLRLRLAISREYEGPNGNEIQTFTPRNTEEVKLYFRGEKTAKMVGRLAQKTPSDGQIISGILVKRNFNCHLMVPEDLPAYTDLTTNSFMQQMHLTFDGEMSVLNHYVRDLACGSVKIIDKGEAGKQSFLVYDSITVHVNLPKVTLEWESNPVNDMYAQALMSSVMESNLNPISVADVPMDAKFDTAQSREWLIEMLGDFFDTDAPATEKPEGGLMLLTVNGQSVRIDPNNLTISCEDESVRNRLSTVMDRLRRIRYSCVASRSPSCKMEVDDK
ncbi:hypothetical protein M514_00093 [Trichuris suis]|uniref:Metallo-beta-lactamase domain-containing protein n=1 Tax=Trichuris suis TaxID=68888 RepID=A0A085NU11_9BILA|nr:hypothetical protein M513_00093 [Trichuris suis]KFD72957.1 hypothetical protein M514_00093 [Trichuris suis]KHJ43273.1 metallo-beta-lactamase domain protein [Trichuris suis]